MPYQFLAPSDPYISINYAAAYQTICRHFAGLPSIEARVCTEVLAECFTEASLRHTPLALQAVREWGGPQAEMDAMEYLASVGFPKEHPLPAEWTEESRRRTPREVRALWGMSIEALRETFPDLSVEQLKGAAVTLSWAAHTIAMERHPCYGDMIRALYDEEQAR